MQLFAKDSACMEYRFIIQVLDGNASSQIVKYCVLWSSPGSGTGDSFLRSFLESTFSFHYRLVKECASEVILLVPALAHMHIWYDKNKGRAYD